jgi:hypothetical protein
MWFAQRRCRGRRLLVLLAQVIAPEGIEPTSRVASRVYPSWGVVRISSYPQIAVRSMNRKLDRCSSLKRALPPARNASRCCASADLAGLLEHQVVVNRRDAPDGCLYGAAFDCSTANTNRAPGLRGCAMSEHNDSAPAMIARAMTSPPDLSRSRDVQCCLRRAPRPPRGLQS